MSNGSKEDTISMLKIIFLCRKLNNIKNIKNNSNNKMLLTVTAQLYNTLSNDVKSVQLYQSIAILIQHVTNTDLRK